MSYINWCEWLREQTAARAPQSASRIFSNIDPLRNFGGVWSLEYTERNTDTIYYISGATRAQRRLSAAFRASTDLQAGALADDFIPTLLQILAQGKLEGRFNSYFIEQKEIGADARGLTVGESFYAFIDFTIVENKDFSAI